MTSQNVTPLTVAVHGATGTQGSHLAHQLRLAGHRILALNSSAADLANVDALVRAYTGADAVVVQLPQIFDPRALAHADNVLAALAKAQVRRVVFNPGFALPPEPVGAPMVDARVRLAEQLPATVPAASVIGPVGPYLENLLQPWSARRVRDHGELAYPLPPQAPVPWVTLRDIGEVIAESMTDPRPPTRVLLAGPEPVTGDQLATAIGAAAKRPVRYTQVDPDEYRRLIEPVMGPAAAAGVAAIYVQATTAPPPPPPVDLLRAGRTTVSQWATQQDWMA